MSYTIVTYGFLCVDCKLVIHPDFEAETSSQTVDFSGFDVKAFSILHLTLYTATESRYF